MKALGKASLSSFLVVLVNVGWYCVALALVVTLLFLVAGSPVGVQIDAGGAPSVEVGSRPMMSIPVSFSIDPQTHPVRASSIGIEDAQLHDARAALKFAPPRGIFFMGNAVCSSDCWRCSCGRSANCVPCCARSVTASPLRRPMRCGFAGSRGWRLSANSCERRWSFSRTTTR